MKVWWRRALGMLLFLALTLVGLVGVAYWRAEAAMSRVHRVDDAPLPMTDADIVRGKHLYSSRGCSDCHGDDGGGELRIDAGPVFRATASNISPTGLAGRYDAAKLAAAIRHGLRADGTSLIFMPSTDYANMSDRDTADLAAYVLQMPAAGGAREASVLGPVGRVLWLFGEAEGLLPGAQIDHAPRQREAPMVAATATYGAYLATVCESCHGVDLAGGIEIAPGSPRSSNLDRARGGMVGWTAADFVRAMREGRRPDGSPLAEVMPWRGFRAMTDTELAALWAYTERPSGTPSAD